MSKNFQITEEMVENWLGTDAPLSEAIETLTAIANGEYKPSLFKTEVKDCYDDTY
jgi:hypothetical protein